MSFRSLCLSVGIVRKLAGNHSGSDNGGFFCCELWFPVGLE